jgi:WD40 repeat protein
LSPDGTALAFDDQDGIIRLCQFTTGKELHRLGREDGRDSFGCFSPDSKRLATIGAYGSIQFWDVTTGRPVNRLSGHGDAIDQLRKKYKTGEFEPQSAVKTLTLGCAFWPDGNTLASYGADATLRLWDVRAGKEILRHRIEGVEFWSVCFFSPNAKVLARFPPDDEVDSRHRVELWDVYTGKRNRNLPRLRYRVIHCEFSPDMRALALITEDATIHVFDMASGRESHTFKLGDLGCPPIVFSPDGKMLASAYQGSLRMWDATTGKELRQLREELGPVHSLFFTPDQKTLVVHEFSAVRFWDLTTGQERSTFTGHLARVHSLAFSDDGKTLVSTGEDQTIRLWDIPTGQQLRSFPEPTGSFPPIVSMTRDARTLALRPNSTACPIRLLDLTTGRLLHQFRTYHAGAGGASVALAFSPDGKTMATAAETGFRGGGGELVFGLRDVATGEVIRKFPVQSYISSLAFSPDGKMLASGQFHIEAGEDPGPVRLWDVATGQPLPALPAQKRQALNVAFSSDGKTLATWDRKSIRLWEIATRRLVWEFEAPKNRCFVSIHFIPDGRVLALSHRTIGSNGEDQDTVRVWDLWQRKELYAAEDGLNYPACATLSPDGALLASASGDSSILLWKLPTWRDTSPKMSGTTDLERLWADLAGPNVRTAYQAIRALVAAPEQSVSFLKAKLRPDPDTHIGQLIADLNNDQFDVREAASHDLARLGENAEPALREAAAYGSLEVRHRAEKLLQHLKGQSKEPTPDQLRKLRALQVLEQAATEDAIQLLQKLASGAPEARLTQEAKASLARLTQRTAMLN